MDQFKAETRLIIRRFLRNRIDFPACITGLEAALANFLPELSEGQMDALRTHLFSDNDVVMAEMADEGPRLTKLRDGLDAHIRDIAPDAVVFGVAAARLPNTLCFAIPGMSAETLVIALDLAGIAVSSGAACSSGKVARSHVLDAMRIEPSLAAGAVRLSLGWSSGETDVACFGEALARIVARMRQGRDAA